MRCRLRILPALSAVVALAGAPAGALAIILDFEDVPPGPTSSYVKGAYQVSHFGGDIASGPGYCTPECPDNGGQYLLHNGLSGPGAWILVSRIDGKPFNLESIDFAEGPVGGPVNDFIVYYAGNNGGNFSFGNLALDGVNDGSGPLQDFETIPLGKPDWANKTHLFIEHRDSGLERFSIDNIVITENVPAISRMAFVGLVLALLGTGSRRIA